MFQAGKGKAFDSTVIVLSNKIILHELIITNLYYFFMEVEMFSA